MNINTIVRGFLCLMCFIGFNTVSSAEDDRGIVVFQSDFGLYDGAVSEVNGVIYSVDRNLIVSNLTHAIPPYNIWDAAYRFYQTASYWPKKTVFLSVVDPGVGTSRRSVVALSNNGYYFVTPDNGTLTFIDEFYGIKEVRTINEKLNRLKGSEDSYTFYGRDVYGYTAAKLASGKISFEEVGPILESPIVRLPHEKARITGNKLLGTIVSLDSNYGNVWTNISKKLADEYGLKTKKICKVVIYDDKKVVYQGDLTLHHTFGDAKVEEELMYFNSLSNLALARNQDSFAQKFNISSGVGWTISVDCK